MVGVAVGRSGNELVSEVEAGKRVHGRNLEGIAHIEIGKQTRNPLGEHGLANSRRAMEEHVMPSGSSDLAGPLGLHLTDHICQVQTTLGVRTGCVTHHLDRVDQRHRLVS